MMIKVEGGMLSICPFGEASVREGGVEGRRDGGRRGEEDDVEYEGERCEGGEDEGRA
jgi:hypothetical protein